MPENKQEYYNTEIYGNMDGDGLDICEVSVREAHVTVEIHSQLIPQRGYNGMKKRSKCI